MPGEKQWIRCFPRDFARHGWPCPKCECVCYEHDIKRNGLPQIQCDYCCETISTDNTDVAIELMNKCMTLEPWSLLFLLRESNFSPNSIAWVSLCRFLGNSVDPYRKQIAFRSFGCLIQNNPRIGLQYCVRAVKLFRSKDALELLIRFHRPQDAHVVWKAIEYMEN